MPCIEAELKRYGRIIGKLMHLTQTRPDIQLAVHILAGYVSAPAKKHMEAALRIVGYVKRTRGFRLQLGGSDRQETELLIGYADSSFAEEEGRKSRTGGIIFYRGSMIYSCSTRQKIVAHSSAEAEYIALDDLATTMVFVRQLLETLGSEVKGPSVVYEDNQSAMIMAQKKKMHTRTKHIELRYHAIRGYVKDGKIKLIYKETEDMTADTLTKPLARKQFEKFRDEMRIIASGGSDVVQNNDSGKGALAISGMRGNAEHQRPMLVMGDVGSKLSHGMVMMSHGRRGKGGLKE
jgi:hypothetical protein